MEAKEEKREKKKKKKKKKKKNTWSKVSLKCLLNFLLPGCLEFVAFLESLCKLDIVKYPK